MDNSTTYSIYRIVNFRNGKVYVGQTKYKDDRYEWHFSALKKGLHHSLKLQNAYNKYGDGAFFFEIIEDNVPKSEINEREIHWIEFYDSFHVGYNMTKGGKQGGNYKPFVLNGVLYESKFAACEANGITENDLAYAIKRKKKQAEENR